MQFFSERYTPKDLGQLQAIRNMKVETSSPSGEKKTPNSFAFLQPRERTRLKELMIHAVDESNMLSNLFYRFDSEGKYVLGYNEKEISSASRRLLGYDVKDFINLKTLDVLDSFYADAKLCDWVEFCLLFCKKSSRHDFRDRVQGLFDDCNVPIVIDDFRLIIIDIQGLRSISSFVKDAVLKTKIEQIYDSQETDPKVLANLTADALHNLFSSETSQDKTRTVSEKMCVDIAGKLSDNKAEQLAELLSETVTLAKKWNNNLSDIRHTDRHKIYLVRPSLYNIPLAMNKSLVELTVTTQQDSILKQMNSDEIVKKYEFEFTTDVKFQHKELDLSTIPF